MYITLSSPQATQCNIQTDRQIYIQTDRHTDRQTDIDTDRQTGRHTDRQTDRHTDRQTDRHTDIDTDRQTYRQKNLARWLTILFFDRVFCIWFFICPEYNSDTRHRQFTSPPDVRSYNIGICIRTHQRMSAAIYKSSKADICLLFEVHVCQFRVVKPSCPSPLWFGFESHER